MKGDDPVQFARRLATTIFAAAALVALGSAAAGTAQSEPYYKNCAEVRAAGKAPLRKGDPGYAEHLDRDGDGVACEPKR